jgi:hypothetical protein
VPEGQSEEVQQGWVQKPLPPAAVMMAPPTVVACPQTPEAHCVAFMQGHSTPVHDASIVVEPSLPPPLPPLEPPDPLLEPLLDPEASRCASPPCEEPSVIDVPPSCKAGTV